MASVGYHEPYEQLPAETRDLHRAITSLMEELEAIDWYGQRVAACDDDELREVLAHNRGEEIEHAHMVLEWIRRRSPDFDAQGKKYLFTTTPIVAAEAAAKAGGDADAPAAAGASSPSLGIGSLKGRR